MARSEGADHRQTAAVPAAQPRAPFRAFPCRRSSLAVDQARDYARSRGLGGAVDPVIESLKVNATSLAQNAGGALLHWIGRLFGSLLQILGLLVLPMLAFYLLAEREAVMASALRFVPDPAACS